jgi:hypothetical protein
MNYSSGNEKIITLATDKEFLELKQLSATKNYNSINKCFLSYTK